MDEGAGRDLDGAGLAEVAHGGAGEDEAGAHAVLQGGAVGGEVLPDSLADRAKAAEPDVEGGTFAHG